jgi:hypothetical protein
MSLGEPKSTAPIFRWTTLLSMKTCMQLLFRAVHKKRANLKTISQLWSFSWLSPKRNLSQLDPHKSSIKISIETFYKLEENNVFFVKITINFRWNPWMNVNKENKLRFLEALRTILKLKLFRDFDQELYEFFFCLRLKDYVFSSHLQVNGDLYRWGFLWCLSNSIYPALYCMPYQNQMIALKK